MVKEPFLPFCAPNKTTSRSQAKFSSYFVNFEKLLQVVSSLVAGALICCAACRNLLQFCFGKSLQLGRQSNLASYMLEQATALEQLHKTANAVSILLHRAHACLCIEYEILTFSCQQANQGSALEAANMLWLIQRDFLEGTTVQQMVKAALEPVQNPNRDADIEEVS